MEKTTDEAPYTEELKNRNAQGRNRLSSQDKMIRQKASQSETANMTQFCLYCKWCEGQQPVVFLESGGHFYATVSCEAEFCSARLRSPNITVEDTRITTGDWKRCGCPTCCQCLYCNLRLEAYMAALVEEENHLIKTASLVLSSMHVTGTGVEVST